MGIFQKSVIQKHLGNLDKELVEKAFQKFRENYNPGKIEKIKELKEEEYQDGFLRDLFVDVFGYRLKPDDNFNLVREFKNQADGKKADGAILKNEKATAVIELKSTKTKDLKSITEQAFNYKNNQPDCKYVITSNFQKLRFYIDYANEFEEFDLFHLQRTDFDLLFLLLNSNSIFSDLPLKLKEETKFHEQDISDKLYKDYSIFKNRLFENLIKNNPENNKLILFNKSQKLLDRFLFILFAEDSGLLPPNSISRIVKRFEVLKEEDAYKPIYDIYKQYFGYMNIGRKGKTTAGDIPAYNGGLFYPDDLLDKLKIDDEILIDDLLKLSEYDFNTEVDVNILGHIFEHSLSEIEEITAEIEGTATDKTKSKRKKDGVFYTPKYITQYIVENTIGTLCNEKRTELEIEEIEFDGTYRTKDGKLSAKGKKLFQKLNDYKDWLLSLKIVDPACGSGAFLNQALNFLIREHKNIDDIIAELTNTALRLFDTEKSILENNLFGVDINEESVEIAKLSLWLRTAHKDRKLSNLNNNIKCGNSLIDDPEFAGDKAFDWNVEFPQIFKEKKKTAWHITTATHNSRYSQRMFDNHVKTGEAIWLTEEDEIIITETVAKIVNDDKLNVIEYNICGDHMHLLMVCEREELPKIVGKIKAITAKIRNIERGYTTRGEDRTTVTRGHVPLSAPKAAIGKEKKEKKEYNPVWTQKFGKSVIKNEEYLNNAIVYIRNNRVKHELPKSERIEEIKKGFLCTKEHAFRTEYKGGFDVVIGNPPYVRSRGLMLNNEKMYFAEKYKTLSYQPDLYKLFIEKSLNIIREKGQLSFITPSVFLSNDYDKPLRKFILDDNYLREVSTSDEDIFSDASVKTVVFVIEKTNNNQPVCFNKIVKGNFTKIKALPKEVFITQNYIINENINLNALSILGKMDIPSKLSEFCEVKNGIKVRKELLFNEKIDNNYKPFLLGKNINICSIEPDTLFIHYISENEKIYTNQAFRSKEIFEQDKLIVRQILGKRIITTFDDNNYYTDQTTYVINSKSKNINLKYLLSIFNSKLLFYYFKNTFSDNKVNFPKVKRSQILEFPIIAIKKQDLFIEKSNNLLDLYERLQEKKTKFLNRVKDNFEIEKISKRLDTFYDFDFKTFIAELKKQKIKLSLVQQDEWEEYFNAYKSEVNQLQSEIEKTDKEIDQMVYELYGLTEEEIKIVEESV
jgi:type I restriction-modification system DNA methylase subunit